MCDLLRHGLLRASFIPSKEQRERRELVRYRKTLIRERADEAKPDSEGPGGSQHQAGRGGDRRARGLWAADAGGDDRGRPGSQAAGLDGQGPAAG